jgi:benzoyl-CoA reductase/2-hydroxyglutaryl-CoA dehydratase subunit BcrC/BadD/HgdB
MQSIKELEVCGHYDQLIAVICNSLCDTLKAMGQKWTKGDTIPLIHFTHAQHRDLPAATTYLVKEYGFIKERLEKLIGYEITEEELLKSIDIYDEHRAVMREFACVAAQYPDIIDIRKRHLVFKSAFFMRKEEHTALVNELLAVLEAEAPAEDKIRIMTSGILADAPGLLEILDDNGMQIVCDDVAAESRQYRTDAPAEGETALDRLASKFCAMDNCSVLYDVEKKRVDKIVSDAKAAKAKGVLVVLTKFCDPEEFDYPLIKRACAEAEIPCVLIEVDRQMVNYEQARTAIETFKDLL